MNSMFFAADVIGLIILFLILLNLGSNHTGKKKADDRIFSALTIVNVFGLLADMMNTSVLVRDGGAVMWLTASAAFTTSIAACALWFIYCGFITDENICGLNKYLIICFVPLTAASALKYYSPLIMVSDGRFDLFFSIIYCMYYALSPIIILKTLFKAERPGANYILKHLYILPLLMIVCEIVKILGMPEEISWLGHMVGIVVIFLNIQNLRLAFDGLTGIYNRMYFEKYLDRQLRSRRQPLFLLMADINKFKSINDNLGHTVGDDALKTTAELIKKSVREDNLVARIGGDEFVVVGKCTGESEAQEALENIRKNISRYNKMQLKPYTVSLSAGYCVINPESVQGAADVISEADRMMYMEKVKFAAKPVPDEPAD